MNIIIFSGSFDPIHIGHINMARKAANDYNAIIYLVPSPIGVWKSESASKHDKLEMLKLSIKGLDNFVIDEFELNSGKNTNYSIDTVRYFKKKFPNDKLYFLIGADQAMKFHLWNDAKELSETAQILYYPRNGYDVPYENLFLYNMIAVDGIRYDSASTDIRDLSKLSVSKDVLNYILEHNLYFVKKVKSLYTARRYEHALSVAKLVIEIAEANNILFNSLLGYFFVAGYLHDVGKIVPIEEQKQIMIENYPEYIDLPEFAFHQFVGAEIARRDFGVTDEIALCAIKYHATGRANMTVLEKIVYAADKIDPKRGYDSSELIDAMKKDIDSGFIKVLEANKKYLESKGKNIHNQLSDECFNYYKIY